MGRHACAKNHPVLLPLLRRVGPRGPDGMPGFLGPHADDIPSGSRESPESTPRRLSSKPWLRRHVEGQSSLVPSLLREGERGGRKVRIDPSSFTSGVILAHVSRAKLRESTLRPTPFKGISGLSQVGPVIPGCITSLARSGSWNPSSTNTSSEKRAGPIFRLDVKTSNVSRTSVEGRNNWRWPLPDTSCGADVAMYAAIPLQ